MTARNFVMIVCVFVGVAGVFAAGQDAYAEAKQPAFSSDPDAVRSRLENVRRLVRSSSGARRVEASDNPQAKEKQAAARQQLADAEVAFDKGDMDGAQAALQKATSLMFEAIRGIGSGKDGVEKKHRDFDNKAASVDVLLNAVERVAMEKGGMDDVRQRAAGIRERAAAAKALADKGSMAQARSLLDEVYEDAKLELERLREGETLVRTLNFANAEEEYHYEVDRNDTHQMLLKVLISENQAKANARKMIDEYVEKSRELRARAEGQAQQGGHAEAVKTLEEATKYLQRAIRSAGVYIPG